MSLSVVAARRAGRSSLPANRRPLSEKFRMDSPLGGAAGNPTRQSAWLIGAAVSALMFAPSEASADSIGERGAAPEEAVEPAPDAEEAPGQDIVVTGIRSGIEPVSYTHLTLPTILLV